MSFLFKKKENKNQFHARDNSFSSINSLKSSSSIEFLPEDKKTLDDISVHEALSRYGMLKKRKSELRKSLYSTLTNENSLTFFLMYMKSIKVQKWVKFWLDVYNLKKKILRKRGDNEKSSNRPQDEIISQNSSSGFCSNSEGSCSGSKQSLSLSPLLNPLFSKSDSLQDIENRILSIFTKYLSGDEKYRLDVPKHLKEEVVYQINSHPQVYVLGVSLFDQCQKFTYHYINQNFYPSYLSSPFHLRHQLDVLTGSSLDVVDLIYHDTSLGYFSEFMEMSGLLDYLQCFLDVDNFQLNFLSHQSNSCTSDHSKFTNGELRQSNNYQNSSSCSTTESNNQTNPTISATFNSNTTTFSLLNTSLTTIFTTTTNNNVNNYENNNKEVSVVNSNVYKNNSKTSNSTFNTIEVKKEEFKDKKEVEERIRRLMMEAQEDSLIIYNKFFSMQAPKPLNLPHGVRVHLEEAISSLDPLNDNFPCGLFPNKTKNFKRQEDEEGDVEDEDEEEEIFPDDPYLAFAAHCFDIPRSLLLYKMQTVYLSLFLTSTTFYNYLSHLITTIFQSKEVPAYKPKSTQEDSDGEYFSHKNTLLASDGLTKWQKRGSFEQEISKLVSRTSNITSPSNEKVHLHSSFGDKSESFQKGSHDFFNSQNSELMLGTIDHVGHFIPNFDLDPEEEKLSAKKKKTKKHLEEEKAVKIAENLMKEIKEMTLGREEEGRSSNSTGTSTKNFPYPLGSDHLKIKTFKVPNSFDCLIDRSEDEWG